MRAAGAGLVVLLLILPTTARARGYESLGVLEREAVDEALAARGLQIEPAPEGKTVGTIHVVNHEVFSPRDPSVVRWLNFFHRTTREDVIRREVLLQPGAAYDEALVDETTRNLRDEDLTSLVVVLPVRSAAPGKVDLLVVTRDVWSLRFNTDFEYQQGILLWLRTSLSENNLLGRRKRVSLNFDLDQGAYNTGPTYVDPNVAGTRLTFSAAYRLFLNRDTNDTEGSSVGATVAYPLFSLASKWGASLSAAYANLVYRRFFRDRLQIVDLPDSPQVEMLPAFYRARSGGVTSSATRSFAGARVIQRVSAGHQFAVVRPRLTDDFPEPDPAVRERFVRLFLPPSERVSALFLQYSIFTPRFRVYRDLDTFDLREDATLGPSASLSVAHAAGWLGSERDHVDLGGSAGYTLDLGDGVQRVSAAWSGRLREGALTDESVSGGLYLGTPMLWNTVRAVAGGGATSILRTSRNRFVALGGESGLRGYAVGEFFGRTIPFRASFLAHAEVRSRPLAIAALRLGALAFYDVGHAAPTFAELVPYNDAGIGVRLLIPQLNYYVLRFDWAFAFQTTFQPDGKVITQAGWPGRISLGFRQVF